MAPAPLLTAYIPVPASAQPSPLIPLFASPPPARPPPPPQAYRKHVQFMVNRVNTVTGIMYRWGNT